MNIMRDMHSVVFQLKEEVLHTRGMAYRCGELAASNILPLQHRLLNLISAITDEAQQKLDILRLGCILFFAEPRRLFGIMGVVSSTQTGKLRGLLKQQRDGWRPFALLKAWVLAMGAMESRSSEREWFFTELTKSKVELGFHTWKDLQGKFQEILWYDEVHTPMFEELCNGIEPEDWSGKLLGGSRFGGYRPLW